MSTDLHNVATDDLVAELARRGHQPRCRCQRWQTYLGAWDRRGYTWRCRGCLKAIDECGCR
jgi:hypothetical protein